VRNKPAYVVVTCIELNDIFHNFRAIYFKKYSYHTAGQVIVCPVCL